MGHKTRIMYIEHKKANWKTPGDARIGRVTFSKTGMSLKYQGREFVRTNKFDANYKDSETGEYYWISGCRRDGQDALYSINNIEIDDDVREEYWAEIRNMPERKNVKIYRGKKY